MAALNRSLDTRGTSTSSFPSERSFDNLRDMFELVQRDSVRRSSTRAVLINCFDKVCGSFLLFWTTLQKRGDPVMRCYFANFSVAVLSATDFFPYDALHISCASGLGIPGLDLCDIVIEEGGQIWIISRFLGCCSNYF